MTFRTGELWAWVIASWWLLSICPPGCCVGCCVCSYCCSISDRMLCCSADSSVLHTCNHLCSVTDNLGASNLRHYTLGNKFLQNEVRGLCFCFFIVRQTVGWVNQTNRNQPGCFVEENYKNSKVLGEINVQRVVLGTKWWVNSRSGWSFGTEWWATIQCCVWSALLDHATPCRAASHARCRPFISL